MTIFPIGDTARARNNARARYMFPGHVFHTQETRKRSERKFRDWDGWLELVAEYRRETALHADTLPMNRPEPLS